MQRDHLFGRQLRPFGDGADILAAFAVVADGQRPARARLRGYAQTVCEPFNPRDQGGARQNQRLVMDHQAAIGRHEFDEAVRRFGGQRGVERHDAGVDGGVDLAAEFDDERAFAGVEKFGGRAARHRLAYLPVSSKILPRCAEDSISSCAARA